MKHCVEKIAAIVEVGRDDRRDSPTRLQPRTVERIDRARPRTILGPLERRRRRLGSDGLAGARRGPEGHVRSMVFRAGSRGRGVEAGGPGETPEGHMARTFSCPTVLPCRGRFRQFFPCVGIPVRQRMKSIVQGSRSALTRGCWTSDVHRSTFQENALMRMHHAGNGSTLIQEIAESVHQTTHGRIRGLAVEEVQGRVVIRGRVSTHHTRQLALHAALKFLSADQCRSCITVD